ncbi:MAG: hypothetical protein ACRC8D_05935 [Aeromonas sp.]
MTQGAARKAAQRERDRTQGVKRIEFRLTAEVATKLDDLCRVRGGVTGPYELAEYLETLIAQDAEKLQLQLDQLAAAPCGKCGRPLPEGCGAVHKGESDCLLTREYRQLLLSEPPRLTIQELDRLRTRKLDK